MKKIILIIVIVAILAGLVYYQYDKKLQEEREAEAQAKIKPKPFKDGGYLENRGLFGAGNVYDKFDKPVVTTAGEAIYLGIGQTINVISTAKNLQTDLLNILTFGIFKKKK